MNILGLEKKSYVFYRYADFHKVVNLERGLERGQINAREDCNAQVFLRVINEFCKSPNTSKKIKRALNC